MPLTQQQIREIREHVASNESWRNDVYPDSLGIPTTGVGFNLNRGEARVKIETLGLDFDTVYAGQVGQRMLTDAQVDQLFSADIADAISAVEARVPEFSGLTDGRQAVLVDMAFNLGPSGFGGFTAMIAAVNASNWDLAADEMASSRWARQVGARATHNIASMRGGAAPQHGGGTPKAKDADGGGKTGDKGKDGKDSPDKGKDGKDGKDRKDSSDKGKDGKDSKDGLDLG